MKTYGPYLRKDGRFHVIHSKDGKKTTESYPRYLWKLAYGDIPKGYDVDHIDDDHTNNSLDNFQLLLKADNARKSNKPAAIVELVCVCCGIKFSRFKRVEIDSRKQGKHGPFCSKSCVGKTYHEGLKYV